MERNRFISSDGNCFEHVGEAAYASPLAAEAHATQIAKELSEDDTGTVVGFRWRISAAIKSRGCRSASEERRRNRKPLGGPRSKRSENRGIMAQTPQDWLSGHRAGLPSYSYEVTEQPFHMMN
jgi:hypothetical protein